MIAHVDIENSKTQDVKTLDLNQEFNLIKKQLDDIVTEFIC